MAIDFSRYTPPGVYVEQSDPTGITGALGVPTTTVTVVGYGQGYQTYTQTVSLDLDQTQTPIPVVLAKKGILPDGNTGPDLVVTDFSGHTLVQDTDYTLTRTATPDGITKIARVLASTKVTDADPIVSVSYAYTDEFYYSPKAFTDSSVVEGIYGPSMVDTLPTTTVPGNTSATSQVSSPLSLAARTAFANGAGTVICLAVEPPVASYRAQFEAAYTKLSTSYAHTMIVPVFDQKSLGLTDLQYSGAFQSLVSDVRAHCEGQSVNGFGRIALVGGDVSLDTTGADTLSHESVAKTIKSNRVVLAYPPRMNYFNSSLGQGTEVGGTYLAAAYAGVLASNEVNRGLTQQPVYGFLGIPEALRAEMDMVYKNSLSSSGVSVVELGRTSTLVCRHGVTTDMSDLSTREISLTRTNDLLYQMVSEAMVAAELIGDPIDDNMTTRVKSVVTSTLETVLIDGLILDYTDVVARQQSAPGGDPTVIECLFTYRPTLPLNYITIGFTMDLSTGAVTPAEEQVTV